MPKLALNCQHVVADKGQEREAPPASIPVLGKSSAPRLITLVQPTSSQGTSYIQAMTGKWNYVITSFHCSSPAFQYLYTQPGNAVMPAQGHTKAKYMLVKQLPPKP
jgi:hypothetical protein